MFKTIFFLSQASTDSFFLYYAVQGDWNLAYWKRWGSPMPRHLSHNSRFLRSPCITYIIIITIHLSFFLFSVQCARVSCAMSVVYNDFIYIVVYSLETDVLNITVENIRLDCTRHIIRNRDWVASLQQLVPCSRTNDVYVIALLFCMTWVSHILF